MEKVTAVETYPYILSTDQKESSLKPRLRDEKGNRQPEQMVIQIPTFGRSTDPDTSTAKYIDEIRKHDSLIAAQLQSYHDDKLHPSYQNLSEAFETYKSEIYDRRTLALKRDEIIDLAIKETNSEMSFAIADLVKQHHEQLEKLSNCQFAAAVSTSLAGLDYDPNNPSATKPFAVNPINKQNAIAHLNIPDDPDTIDDAKLDVISTVLLFFTGSVLGLSFGIFTEQILPEDPFGDTIKFAVFALVGVAAAYSMGYGLTKFFRNFAQAIYIESMAARLQKGFCAFLALAMSISAIVATEMFGSLKLAQAAFDSSEHASIPAIAFISVGLLISTPYPLLKSIHGYIYGRKLATDQLASALIEQRLLNDQSVAKFDANRQSAAKDIHAVVQADCQQKQTAQQIAAEKHPFLKRIEFLESLRIAHPTEANLDNLHKLVEDAHDNLISSQMIYDYYEDQALARIGYTKLTFFERLKQLFRRKPSGSSKSKNA